MVAPPFPAAALAAAREAVKAHLRISGSGEDAVVTAKVETALALCEAFTGQALVIRAWQEVLAAAPHWQRLARTPVAVIEAVENAPASGGGAALPVANYAIDIDAHGGGWVRVTRGGGRVRVTYSAGIDENWDGVPAPLAQGAVLLAAHLLEARADGGAPPAAVAALWRPWRRVMLDGARRRA